MFNYKILNEKNYYVVGSYKNNKIYSGVYTKINNKETITSINSGEKYYRIEDFLQEIHGLGTETELTSFMIYKEDIKRWCPLTMILI